MPTSAVMTSIESASMIVWLMPSMISGSASGRRDLGQDAGTACSPTAVAASMSAGRTLRMPCAGVADGRRQRVEHDGDHRGEIADPEQHDHRDQVDEARQGLQRVDDRLRERARTAVAGPMPMMPSGMPISAGDDDRDAAEIDGLHRLFPLAGDGDEQRERRRRAAASRAPAETPAGEGERGHEQRARAGRRMNALDRDEHVEEQRVLIASMVSK